MKTLNQKIVTELTHFKVKDIISILEENTAISNNRKVKYSNNPILTMLSNFTGNESFGLIRSKSEDIPFDRGRLVECIVKATLQGRDKVETKPKGYNDLPRARKEDEKQFFEAFGLMRSKDYEIKFSTSYAYATPLAPNNRNDVIIVTPRAVFVVPHSKVATNSSDKVITKQDPTYYNKELTELLYG